MAASAPALCTIFFATHWLLSHITIVDTMDSEEKVMNPVAMTISDPQKEYWLSYGAGQNLFGRVNTEEQTREGLKSLRTDKGWFEIFENRQGKV